MAELIRTHGGDNGDDFKVYLGDPEELRKLINASRRRHFHLRFGFEMPTTEGRGYPLTESLRVTQAQALKFVAEAIRFRKRRAEMSPETPEADLPKLEWTVCDTLIFIN